MRIYRSSRSISSASRNFMFVDAFKIIFLIGIVHSANAKGSFKNECSANSRLICRVMDGLCGKMETSHDYPDAPQGLRVSPYVGVDALNLHSYQLMVEISFTPTHKDTIFLTKGFELTVVEKSTSKEMCFTLMLEKPQWNSKDRENAVRFRFTATDVFAYSESYYVEVQALPKPANASAPINFIHSLVTMPDHPETGFENVSLTGDYCTKNGVNGGVHPQAFRWVASYPSIYVQSKARLIYVTFIAAPPQYCFEEYEVRLIKDTHYVIAIGRVKREDLHYRMWKDVMVALGNYSFYNVENGLYDIGVSAVDHSTRDRRCLCPKDQGECSCTLSIWPNVEVNSAQPTYLNPCDQLPPPKLPFHCLNDGTNSSFMADADPPQTPDETNNFYNILLILVCLLVLIIMLTLSTVAVVRFYHRYKAKRGMPPIYTLSNNRNGGVSSHLISGDRELTTMLRRRKVLIVYARDCPQHEAAVRSLAYLLSTRGMCDVEMDETSINDITANKFDWTFKSMANADWILLVNSFGAYMRYQAKAVGVAVEDDTSGDYKTNTTTIIERVDGSHLDDLFLLQLDMLACQQQQKLIACRLSYTPAYLMLPQAGSQMRYELPDHLRSLAISLHGLASLEDYQPLPPQLEMFDRDRLQDCEEGRRLWQCVSDMKELVANNSDWFERLHVRRPVSAREVPTKWPPTEPKPDERPLVKVRPSPPSLRSTAATMRAGDSGYEELLQRETDADKRASLPPDFGAPMAMTPFETASSPLLTQQQPSPLMNGVGLDTCDSGIGEDECSARAPEASFAVPLKRPNGICEEKVNLLANGPAEKSSTKVANGWPMNMQANKMERQHLIT